MQPLFPCVPNAVAGPNVLTLLVMLCTILGCNFIATFNTASLGASLWHLAPFYFHANKDSRSDAMKQCTGGGREKMGDIRLPVSPEVSEENVREKPSYSVSAGGRGEHRNVGYVHRCPPRRTRSSLVSHLR